MVGLVSLNIIEEVVSEDCLLSCNEILLLLVLNVAEVNPSVEGESAVAGKTTEGLIDLNLVERSVFEGATGNREAGTVDLVHSRCESVQLGQVLGWEHECVAELIDNLRSFL